MAGKLWAHESTLGDKIVELTGNDDLSPEEVLTRMARFAGKEDYIEHVAVIGIDGGGNVFVNYSGEVSIEKGVFMMEMAKMDLLNRAAEDEDVYEDGE